MMCGRGGFITQVQNKLRDLEAMIKLSMLWTCNNVEIEKVLQERLGKFEQVCK